MFDSHTWRYADYVLYHCGGWGWEVAAGAAVCEAKVHLKTESHVPLHRLSAVKISEICWVDALVFFLMGMKDSK